MKFSLIMVSHNPNLDWYHAALDSAWGLFDECIIIDDGSDIPIQGANVRHNKNMGIMHSRNNGVAIATGDVITWLDDDDEFIPDVVEEMKQFVIDNPADLYPIKIQCFGEHEDVWSGHQDPELMYEASPFIGHSWYRKDMWHRLGGYTYPVAEDWDFFIKAIKLGMTIKPFDKVFYKYRVRKDSASYWRSYGEAFENVRQEIRELHK
jgi:glycosyltransferase involved in cell wall biosynthesis